MSIADRIKTFYQKNPEAKHLTSEPAYQRFIQWTHDHHGSVPVGSITDFIKLSMDVFEAERKKEEAEKYALHLLELAQFKKRQEEKKAEQERYDTLKNWLKMHDPELYTYEKYKEYAAYHSKVSPYDSQTARKGKAMFIRKWKQDSEKFQKLSEPGQHIRWVASDEQIKPNEPYSDGDLSTVRTGELFNVLGIFYRTHKDNTWLEWLYVKFQNEVLRRQNEENRSNQAPSGSGYFRPTR